MLPRVSVIIPSMGRIDRLVPCIRSVVSQNTSFHHEILVIIDGDDSQQAAERIMGEFGSIADIHVNASSVRRGSPEAKNIGASMAKGEILVFIDDDVIAKDGWLSTLISGYQEGIVGVGGSEEKRDELDFLRVFWFKLGGSKTGLVTASGQVISNFSPQKSKPEHVQCLAGANMSFRRESFLSVNGFDTRYSGTSYREETDLCLRINGRKGLLFLPDAVVEHYEHGMGGNTPSSEEEWNYWYHRNNTYFYLKNLSGKATLGWLRHLLSEFIIACARVISQKSLAPLSTMGRGIRDGRRQLETPRGARV